MKAKQTIYFKRQALGLTIPIKQTLTLSNHMVIVCQRLSSYKNLSGRSSAPRKKRADGMGNYCLGPGVIGAYSLFRVGPSHLGFAIGESPYHKYLRD